MKNKFKQMIFVSLLVILNVAPNIARTKYLIDLTLLKHKNKILQFLVNQKEIKDTTKLDYVFEGSVYSRIIFSINDNIKYYEIGVMSPHSYKYIAIVSKGEIVLLESKDFNKEYESIIYYFAFEKKKYKLSYIYQIIKDIREIYQYNLNPPWKIKELIKK